MVNDRVISKDSLDILRALQDDSLTWLANIPVSGLVELRERLEHSELRDHLKKITAQLTSAGAPELDAVVREVRHGLEVLIQEQRKSMKDIEARYSSKNWTAGAGSHWGVSGRDHVLLAVRCGYDWGYGSNGDRDWGDGYSGALISMSRWV